MPSRHVVVDGSNIATEGRSLPSLAQLDEAVREFLGENPDDIVTVVVDASFGHRIDPVEASTFEEAEEAGEVVSPPAGAIGRGDAFLLRIAEKTGATVLSNDSFQEFHGEHEWLFESGRLIGGKPVPGVGWIFTPRTPVRGPKSREAVKEAKRRLKSGAAGEEASGLEVAAERAKGKGKVKKVERAIARATEEAVDPTDDRRRHRKRGGQPPAEPVNEPLAFITFIATHPLGSEVTGVVESFSSHGAFVAAENTRCYVPLSALGVPAPRSAREVLTKGEKRIFVVQALDPLRRGVELALPEFVHIAGAPTDETVEAEIRAHLEDEIEPAAPETLIPAPAKALPVVAAKRRGRKAVATGEAGPEGGARAREGADGTPAPVAAPAAAAARPARKRLAAPAVVVPPTAEATEDTSPTTADPAAKKSLAKKEAAAKQTAPKKVAAKKAVAKKAVAKKAAAVVGSNAAVEDGSRQVRKRAAKKTTNDAAAANDTPAAPVPPRAVAATRRSRTSPARRVASFEDAPD